MSFKRSRFPLPALFFADVVNRRVCTLAEFSVGQQTKIQRRKIWEPCCLPDDEANHHTQGIVSNSTTRELPVRASGAKASPLGLRQKFLGYFPLKGTRRLRISLVSFAAPFETRIHTVQIASILITYPVAVIIQHEAEEDLADRQTRWGQSMCFKSSPAHQARTRASALSTLTISHRQEERLSWRLVYRRASVLRTIDNQRWSSWILSAGSRSAEEIFVGKSTEPPRSRYPSRHPKQEGHRRGAPSREADGNAPQKSRIYT